MTPARIQAEAGAAAAEHPTAGDRGTSTDSGEVARTRELDGLRGLAVLAVLAYHAHYSWAGGGFIGVDVFFVLSGYLITDLLLSRTIDPRNGHIVPGGYRTFLLRRARRLMPAYAGMLIGATACAALLGDEARQLAAPRCLAAAATHTMNLPYAETLGCDATWHVAWSLAAEEQFYLAWPLLLVALVRYAPPVRGSRLLGAALAVAALTVAAAAWQLALRTGYPRTARVMFAPDGRSLIILLGCALALWLRWPARCAIARRSSPWAGAASWFAAATLVISAVKGSAGNEPHQQMVLLCASIAAATLILQAVQGQLPVVHTRFLTARPLRMIGTLSYSLYLWHEIAYRVVDSYLTAGTPADEAARLCLSLVFAFLSWRFVEMRFACGPVKPPRVEVPAARQPDRRVSGG